MAKSLPHPFQPMEEEPYMNPRQVNFFRTRLIKWREELAVSLGSKDLLLREEMDKAADWIDHAADRAQRILLFARKEHAQNILKEIDAALNRIENGTFGYCEESGEEIGIRRLTVYPIARLSVEAQERREYRRRLFGGNPSA